jgi:hypothetical protein
MKRETRFYFSDLNDRWLNSNQESFTFLIFFGNKNETLINYKPVTIFQQRNHVEMILSLIENNKYKNPEISLL